MRKSYTNIKIRRCESRLLLRTCVVSLWVLLGTNGWSQDIVSFSSRIDQLVAATNAGSNGNGRLPDKDGKYPGNRSSLHVFALPEGQGSRFSKKS